MRGKFFGKLLGGAPKRVPVGERTMTPQVQDILTGRASSRFISPTRANEKALHTAVMEGRMGSKELERARKAKTQLGYNVLLASKAK